MWTPSTCAPLCLHTSVQPEPSGGRPAAFVRAGCALWALLNQCASTRVQVATQPIVDSVVLRTSVRSTGGLVASPPSANARVLAAAPDRGVAGSQDAVRPSADLVFSRKLVCPKGAPWRGSGRLWGPKIQLCLRSLLTHPERVLGAGHPVRAVYSRTRLYLAPSRVCDPVPGRLLRPTGARALRAISFGFRSEATPASTATEPFGGS